LSDTWAILPTALDTYHNTASAPARGEGLYALMSSVEIPLYGPGWNQVAYPVAATRLVTEALASIDGHYTTVCHPDIQDITDPWKCFGVGVPLWVNDLHEMAFGEVYWIYLSDELDLTLYLDVGEAGVDESKSALRPQKNPTMGNPPAIYYGQVGAGVSFTPLADMPVTAWVNGIQCGQANTLIIDGQVVYVVDVSAAAANNPGCGVLGFPVDFQVGDQPMQPSPPWDDSRMWQVVLMPDEQNYLYLPLIHKP
jgi:hypothetical protein